MLKLAIVISHPIQYFVPWYQELAKLPNLDLRVFYSCDWGVTENVDPQFGVSFRWDIPMLEGYEHEFLPIAKRPEKVGFWEVDNPTVGEALARFGPDVVNISGYAQRTTWRVARWTQNIGKLLLMMSDSTPTLEATGWRRAIKQVVVKHFYRKLDGALYISDKNRQYHLNYGLPAERLFRGCLPIDRTRLLAQTPDKEAARNAIRERYGIPPEAFVVMFCGKYVARKRPLDLVMAGHHAAQKGLPVWTLLVGEGAERTALEDYCRREQVKNCVLTGFVNQGGIAEYYAAADLMAMTSSEDFHPLIISEGGTFGLPLVISEHIGCVGAEGSARPGINALTFPCGDVPRLTDAIIKLYQEKELYRQMSASAFQLSGEQDVTVAARSLQEAAESLRQLGPR